MLVSPLVLDAVDQNLRLSNGQSGNVARNPVAGQVKVSVGKKDLLIRLDVTAATPEASQNMANAVIDSWLKSTTPNGQDRADLEKRLDYAQKSLDVVTGLLERLAAGDADKLNILRPRGEAAVTFVALAELQARHLADVLSISRSLQGQSRDVVLQPPTLPTEPAPSKKALMATLAALGTGFALLLFVFVRAAWRGAAQDPEAAQKQTRLRAALGLK